MMESIKQEIKEEIPDEYEQYDSMETLQNVKNELEFEDNFENYEYASVTDEQEQEQHLDFNTELRTQPKTTLNSHSIQCENDFDGKVDSDDDDQDEDKDEDEDDDVLHRHQFQTEYENQIYVEPEIYVEDISYSKENASDPLALNTNVVVHSAGNLPKAVILNSTHTPLVSSSVKILVRQQQPPPPPPSTIASKSSPPSFVTLVKNRPIERPAQIPSVSSVYVRRKAPPVNELFRKTYSLEHRLAHKTTGWNTCQVCARKFYNPTEFEMHQRRCHFSCKKCNLIFQTLGELRAHHQKCKILSNCRGQKVHNNKDTNKSTLIVIDKKTTRRMDSCDICCTKFSSWQELDLHRKQNHLVKGAYACHKCERRFDNSNDAVLHLKRDH